MEGSNWETMCLTNEGHNTFNILAISFLTRCQAEVATAEETQNGLRGGTTSCGTTRCEAFAKTSTTAKMYVQIVARNAENISVNATKIGGGTSACNKQTGCRRRTPQPR